MTTLKSKKCDFLGGMSDYKGFACIFRNEMCNYYMTFIGFMGYDFMELGTYRLLIINNE